jgi:lipopolysaccharide transport system ATP-binding protein
MNDAVISVKNIGKKYQLGFTHRRKGYKTLRDTLTHKIGRMIGGRRRNQNLTKNEQSKNAQNNETTSGEFWALKDISFDVRQGEVVGIIGRNGAGKSTLLKILSQITEPTEGEIRIKGRVASLLEVGTGFHGELSGRENVYMNGAILGMTKAEIKSKFDEIVSFAEVAKFIDTPVKRYSSGMQVRLAFAVAAHLEPEILVVDEVLAVGDMEFQKKCIGKMDKVSKQGRTVLFVSHNMGIISKLCQRGILLESGRIKLNDNINSVVKNYLSIPSAAGDVDLLSVKNRSGSGSALFARVITRNGDGAVCDTFTIGDTIAIDVTILHGQWLRSGRMSLQVSSSEGIQIYHLVAYDAGFELNNLRDKETVRVVLKKQKLYPGDYYVSLWLADRACTTLDNIQNAFKFSVSEGGELLCRPIDKSSAVVHEIPDWTIVRS